MKRLGVLVGLLCLVAGMAVAQGMTADAKKELADLSKLSALRDSAKAGMLKHPKDAAAKTRFVKLNDLLANKTMVADALGPRVKYPKALRLYRETLKVSPRDPEATQWVKTIESIYKSMKRPIPQ